MPFGDDTERSNRPDGISCASDFCNQSKKSSGRWRNSLGLRTLYCSGSIVGEAETGRCVGLPTSGGVPGTDIATGAAKKAGSKAFRGRERGNMYRLSSNSDDDCAGSARLY